MQYRILEKLIRNKFGDSALDNWIVDCRVDVRAKIASFNFFCDIHYGALSDDKIAECAFELERRLQTVKPGVSPIDRLKGLVDAKFPCVWEAQQSEAPTNGMLSRVLPADSLMNAVALANGLDSSMFSYPVSEVDVTNLIKEHAELLVSGVEIIMTLSGGLIWHAPDVDVVTYDSSLNGSPDKSSLLRDLLGLPYRSCHLVRATFPHDPLNNGVKPTVFHSGFWFVWKPCKSSDGWGVTLNLSTMQDGVRESVRRNGPWPKCVLTALGECDGQGPRGDLSRYLGERIVEFRNWANGNIDAEEDLTYFVGKWQ